MGTPITLSETWLQMIANTGGTAPSDTELRQLMLAFSQGLGGGGNGWFNVQEQPYGAKGDGVTDDAPAFQAAVNAAQGVAGGGVVYVPDPPSGVYLWGETVWLNEFLPMPVFIGEMAANGFAFIRQMPNKNLGAMLSGWNWLAKSCNGLQIYGLAFDGNMANQGTVARTVGVRAPVARSHIFGLECTNCFWGMNASMSSIGQNAGDGNLNGGINSSVPTINMNAGQGVRFPISIGNPNFQPFVIRIDSEDILVGATNGDTFTNCTRGYESTTPASHSNGADIAYQPGNNVDNLENIMVASYFYNNWGVGLSWTTDSQIVGGFIASNGFDPTGNTTSGNVPYIAPNGLFAAGGLMVNGDDLQVVGTHLYANWVQIFGNEANGALLSAVRMEDGPNQAVVFNGQCCDWTFTACSFQANGNIGGGGAGTPLPNQAYNATLVPAVDFQFSSASFPSTGISIVGCRFPGAQPGVTNTQVWLYAVRESGGPGGVSGGADYNQYLSNIYLGGVATPFHNLGTHTITTPLIMGEPTLNTSTPTTGQLMQFNGTDWVPATVGPGNATSIQGTNVSATAPTTGEVFYFNGSVWIPTPGVLFGGAGGAVLDGPPSQVYTYMQYGVGGATLDGSGRATVTFPNAFPNGVGVVIVTPNAIGVSSNCFDANTIGFTLTTFTFIGFLDGVVAAGDVFSYQWVAYGW